MLLYATVRDCIQVQMTVGIVMVRNLVARVELPWQ